jgi:hypothetical protein
MRGRATRFAVAAVGAVCLTAFPAVASASADTTVD